MASTSVVSEERNQGSVWSHNVPVSSGGSEIIDCSNDCGVTSGKPEGKKESPKI